MSDFLLELSRNPQARALIKRVGLPIPLPESLRRDPGPWQARPLADRKAVVGAAAGAELVGAVAETLAAAGADPYLEDAALLPAFEGPGETYGRPARTTGSLEDTARLDALVFDASSVRGPEGLRALYDFFHALAPRVVRSGRVVVLGRPSDGAPAQAAAQAALDGFTRSLAKELGRGGATANLVLVEPGAERRLVPVLRWLLSARSAFVTAQPISVNNRARGADEPSFVRPLEKKKVLVTGAARGIGEATARLMAQEGAHVICLDRPADDGPTSQLARELGGTALLVDITAADAPEQIATAVRGLGGLDVIVHNAGITRDKTIAKMKPELWDQAVAVNLGAVVRVTDKLLADGLLADGGRVICLSSVAGIAGNVGQTNYAASKAGIIGFVRALADRLAERGITANAIAPGFIETRLTIAMPVAVREVARRLSAVGQGGLPQDVGQAITFLATPGAQGITGSVLRVCGGALVGA